jgi:ubiquinone/menaquinone biosynthesis C-methylase UbiE
MTATMEETERKRPREGDEKEKEKEKISKKKKPPAYGSQEYWEDRYQQQLQQTDKSDKEQMSGGDEAPDAFHAWYFGFDELAPLILPLILGEGGDVEEGSDGEDKNEAVKEKDKRGPRDEESDNEKDDDDDDDEKEQTAGTETNQKNGDDGTNEEDENEEESEVDEEDVIEIDDSDDEEEEAPKRVGLARDGPISILEVGCGDVPLGRGIVKGIQDLESVAGVKATNILKRVVCLDYSKSVIESMKVEQQKIESDGSKWQVALEYAVADARDLPYANESFELVLEKGTMDAMLSDTEVGAENCRAIMSECARVLVIGGELFLFCLVCTRSRGTCKLTLLSVLLYRLFGNCVSYQRSCPERVGLARQHRGTRIERGCGRV